MSDVLSAQHPPAQLAVVASLPPHVPNPTTPRESAPTATQLAQIDNFFFLGTPYSGASSPTTTRPADNADYPRPAAGGDTETHPPHNEEEAPKKEKKHGHGGHDQNRLKESVYRKVDATAPSKDHLGAKHSFGAGGRIGQPMGKALAV